MLKDLMRNPSDDEAINVVVGKDGDDGDDVDDDELSIWSNVKLNI